MPMNKANHYAFFIACLICLLGLALTPTATTSATLLQSGTLQINIEDLPAEVASGETFSFDIFYGCTGTTNNCGPIEVVTSIPTSRVTNISVQTVGSDKLVPLAPQVVGDDLVLTLQTNPSLDSSCTTTINDGCFRAGEGATATFTVTVAPDAYDAADPVVPIEVEGRSNTDIGGNITTENEDVPITPPVFDWSVGKSRTFPAGTREPAPDEITTYAIDIEPDSSTGNFVLENVVVTDTLPPGAVPALPIPDGGVYNAGTNTITWNFASIDFTSGGRTILFDVIYPSGTFTPEIADGPDTTNTVTNSIDFSADYDDGNQSADCTDVGCPGVSHGFDDPTFSATGSKVLVPPNTPVSLDGIGRFRVSTGITDNNVPQTNSVITDELQEDGGGNLPLEVIAIDNVDSIEVSTVAGCGSGFTTITDVNMDGIIDENDDAAFSSPNSLRCFRATGVNSFDIVFQPRDGIATDNTTYSPANCFDAVLTVTSQTAGDLTDTSSGCANVTITEETSTEPVVQVSSEKILSDVQTQFFEPASDPAPTRFVTFRVSAELTERSTNSLGNIVIADALSDEFDPTNVTFTIYDPQDQLTPTQESNVTLTIQQGVTVDISAARDGSMTEMRDLYVWTFPNDIDIPPPGLTGTPPVVGVNVTARVKPYTPVGNYSNIGYLYAGEGDNLFCEGNGLMNGAIADTNDIDDDGDTAELLCRTVRDFSIPATAVLNGQKWIRNLDQSSTPVSPVLAPGESGVCEQANEFTDVDADFNGVADGTPFITEADYSRFPCITEGLPGNVFTYRFSVQNDGNDILQDYVLYDILPYTGDTGVSSGSLSETRDSEWTALLTSVSGNDSVVLSDVRRNPAAPAGVPAISAANFTIEGSTSNNPCRPEVGISTGCDTVVWTDLSGITDQATLSTFRSFRAILAPGIDFEPGDELEFTVTMIIPTDDLGNDTPLAGDIAWNNYAHTAFSTSAAGFIPGIDVIKVGIRVPETVSVGNRVWYDDDNDRENDMNADEPPIPGVDVELWEWDSVNNVLIGSAPLATTTTDADGFYIFNLDPDGLDLSPNPENTAFRYVVVIADSNFAPGGPLENHISSYNYINGAERRTNGDELDVGGDDTTNEIVRSQPFGLTANGEDTGDNTRQTGGDHGPFGHGNLGQDNNNSDLTIDFGFFIPVAVGNRVWFDTGPTTDTNNSVEDASEQTQGIPGVTVELYRAANLNNLLTTTTTDADGYYIFDGLEEDTYVVVIADSNFDFGGPLFAFEDSDLDAGGNPYEPTTDDDLDQDDDGRPDNFLGDNGVRSDDVVLTIGGEPLFGGNEVDQSNFPQDNDPAPTDRQYAPQRRTDENTNLTVDFGFFTPTMSLGNFVWEDLDGDSIYDGDYDGVVDADEEPGIDGVIVRLILDADADGVADADEIDGTGTGAQILETVTAGGGYYLFDALEPGPYFVLLVPENWTSGATTTLGNTSTGVLEEYVSSRRDDTIDSPTGASEPYAYPDEWDDQQDDGLNRASYADYVSDGIITDQVLLTPVSEAPGDDSLTDLGEDGDGDSGTSGGPLVTEPHVDSNVGAGNKDSNSDLTVDFGVHIPFSLGNYVWEDIYGDGTGAEFPGDGVYNATEETGIDGVEVRLYVLRDPPASGIPRDPTNTGNFQSVPDYPVQITGDGGFYLFDNLGEGTYRVRVLAGNFGTGDPLEGYISSDGVDGNPAQADGDARNNFDSRIEVNDIPTNVWSDFIVL